MLPGGFPGRVSHHPANDQRRYASFSQPFAAGSPEIVGGGVLDGPSGSLVGGLDDDSGLLPGSSDDLSNPFRVRPLMPNFLLQLGL